MRKGIILSALALVSLLALNGTVFMALADPPTVFINPLQGLIGESFNFDFTATGESTVSEVKVVDPDSNTWVLKGLTSDGWKIVKIWLYDVGDSVRLIWPEISWSIFSELADVGADNIEIKANGLPITDLAWWNSAAKPAHTSVVGTYEVWSSGSGCSWFSANSLYVLPEGPLGTLSFLLICVASLAIYKRVRRPQVKL